jgi:hypothetical protein
MKTSPVQISDKLLTPEQLELVTSLSIYQVFALLVLIFFSGPLLGLSYHWDTPEYLDEDHTIPSNKTRVFSMVVQTFVLMLCNNICMIKVQDEAELSWFERFSRHREFVYAISFIILT